MKERAKRTRKVLLGGCILILALAGCGDKSGSAATKVKAETLLTHEELAIVDYVEGRTQGNMTEEEYLYLA